VGYDGSQRTVDSHEKYVEAVPRQHSGGHSIAVLVRVENVQQQIGIIGAEGNKEESNREQKLDKSCQHYSRRTSAPLGHLFV
jgi:hypothetical protein